MNLIAINSATVRTMTSRELATLAEKRHDNVMRVIDALERAGLILPQAEEVPNEGAGPRMVAQYRLNQRDSYVVMARLSPEFTARLVDRWQELESSTPKPAELSRMDILRLAMESEEAKLKAEAERDEAIRTKALIGSKREATAMATASAAKREVSRLREELGACARHATITAVKNATGIEYSFMPLRAWCKRVGVSPAEVPDKRYGSVKAWPADAWLVCYEVNLSALFGEVAA
jgi:phage regulator Rha-like protein